MNMIRGNDRVRNISAKLDAQELLGIQAYIRGAVYCWCKNCKNDDNSNRWFSARALFGGANSDWQDTPLYPLYEWHQVHDTNDPFKRAGNDLGYLLKGVLREDQRIFNTRRIESDDSIREYRWTGEVTS